MRYTVYTTRSIRPLPARGKSADTPPHGPLGGFDSAQLDCGGRTVLGAIHVNEMEQDRASSVLSCHSCAAC